MRPPKVYVVGSLRNPNVPLVAAKIRALGYDTFDDWYSAGPNADDHLRDYEKSKGHGIKEALQGHAARHIYNFDLGHLTTCDIVVLVMPAGKSGHLEFGWALGKGKKGYVLFEQEPERIDIMYQFATGLFTDEQSLLDTLGGLL